MTSFWQERNPRERMLLVLAGALCLLTGLYQFAWAPLAGYRVRAAASLAEAEQLYADIAQGAAIAAAARAGSGQVDARPLRIIASDSARELGLSITRFQPAENGDLSIWLDQADARLLWRWLATLHQVHGVSAVKAVIQRDDGQPTVRAQLLLRKLDAAS